jgi:hypothetical protein
MSGAISIKLSRTLCMTLRVETSPVDIGSRLAISDWKAQRKFAALAEAPASTVREHPRRHAFAIVLKDAI